MESNKNALKIGIFGGTFNPPHLGHKNAVVTAMNALKLDKMLLVPSNIPPHKTLPPGSPSQAQRLDMVRLLAAEIPNCEAVEIELARGGKSYTADTVRALSEVYPNAKFWLVMGTDMFMSFAKWRQPKEIAKYCHLAVMMREPLQKDELLNHALFLEKTIGIKTDLIDIDILEISSTQARNNIASHINEGLLIKSVAEYISKNSLYSALPAPAPSGEMQEFVKSQLSEKRYCHTLGCVKYAIHLAKIFGEDENAAATAALLHDSTKEITYEKQLKLCAKYGIIFNYTPNEAPKLLHADTAAALAREKFHVSPQIEQAIARHTTGEANMSRLDKIMYLADMLEENRDFEGVEELRSLSEKSLEAALIESLTQSVEYIKSKNIQPNVKSQEALEYLLKESRQTYNGKTSEQ